MENFTMLVAKVREHYVSAYVATLSPFLRKFQPAAPEVLLELEREAPYPFQLYRADMMSNVEGDVKIQEVNPSSYLNFEPRVFTPLPELMVQLHPFAWFGVDFQTNVPISAAALAAWTLRWLDIEDQRPQDMLGLQGVIHAVTPPETQGNFSAFTVDFGSAPIHAFEELLRLIKEQGATLVEIRSSVIG